MISHWLFFICFQWVDENLTVKVEIQYCTIRAVHGSGSCLDCTHMHACAFNQVMPGKTGGVLPPKSPLGATMIKSL